MPEENIMATLNPAIIPRLVELAQALDAAKHGEGGKLKEAACLELGMSLATLHRALAQVSVRDERKQRSDKGVTSLPREEALKISGMLIESLRKTGKRLMSIEQAVGILIANGEVKADSVSPDGEIRKLSTSAIASALRSYGLHPDQLLRPEPAVELKSLHPNHVWSVDASLCVLYYLNDEGKSGLQVMDSDKFYKNKPKNLKRIESDRVWSYEITDHFSGTIFVHYVMGSESAMNLTESFVAAISKRDNDPFHGVPFVLMMDRGSANTSGLFGNLARRLGIKTIAHAPGNARATGQVEKARDQIERSFESGLKLAPVRNLEHLNQLARRWAIWYNTHKVHTRTKKPRYNVWLTIMQDQLRIAPPRQVCLELLSSNPETRKVDDYLRISFKGREFDVRSVPSVMVGETLTVCTNPYATDSVQIILRDGDGQEVIHLAPEVERDGVARFGSNANVIGEDYKRHAPTQLEINRADVAKAVYGVDTQEQADAARKAKALPFGGRIDPMKVINDTPLITFIPKRGNELEVATTTVSTPKPKRMLTAFEAAQTMASRGITMTAQIAAHIKSKCSDEGIAEEDLDALYHSLTVRSSLRVVNGGW